MELGGARDWNDPRFLGQQPGEGDLRRRRSLVGRESVEQIHECLVYLAVLLAETRDRAAEIGAVEFGVGADLASEEALAQRAEWHEANSQLFKRRHDRLLRLPPPQRVLALQRGDGLNRVRASDGLCAGLRQTEVLHLALVDQVLHRTRDVFDRYVKIDAMLVIEVNRLDPESFQRSLHYFFDVLRPAVQCTPPAAVPRARC